MKEFYVRMASSHGRVSGCAALNLTQLALLLNIQRRRKGNGERKGSTGGINDEQ